MKINNKKIMTFKRRFVTLIEMMIVMFLIALITGVVAYNYRGTLEEGKAFKSKAGIEKLQTILSLAMADNPDADFSGDGWKAYVTSSPLVQNAKALIKDGWGEDYTVETDNNTNTINVHSNKFDAYKRSHATSMFKD